MRLDGAALVADFRPPSGRVLNRIVAVVTAHAMAHNNAHELGDLISDGGFTIIATGETRVMHYVNAQRPQ